MRTIEGYLEKGRFYPIGHPAEIRGRRRVLVTVLNDDISRLLDETNANEKNVRAAWLNRLNEAVAVAQDEVLPEVYRSKEMRLPLDFADLGDA